MPETTAKNPAGEDAKTDEAAERARTGDKAHAENKPGEMDDRLDEALEETFPSSDPVSVKITK